MNPVDPHLTLIMTAAAMAVFLALGVEDILKALDKAKRKKQGRR